MKHTETPKYKAGDKVTNLKSGWSGEVTKVFEKERRYEIRCVAFNPFNNKLDSHTETADEKDLQLSENNSRDIK